jgi:hypothetical protein
MLPAMDRSIVECELTEGAVRLRRVRDDLSEVERLLAEAVDVVEDLRLKATVSETPIAAEQLIGAQRQASALRRAQERLTAEVLALRGTQDALLDRLPRPPR